MTNPTNYSTREFVSVLENNYGDILPTIYQMAGGELDDNDEPTGQPITLSALADALRRIAEKQDDDDEEFNIFGDLLSSVSPNLIDYPGAALLLFESDERFENAIDRKALDDTAHRLQKADTLLGEARELRRAAAERYEIAYRIDAA